MKIFFTLCLVALHFSAPLLRAQSTAFTYQGRLLQGGNPANGQYEMQFTLFDALANGNQVGVPVSLAPVAVSNGLFTVTLDFGASAFTGANRWLEITVNLYGSDMVPTTLSPRQPFTATPYALHAANAAGLMSFANAPLDIKVNGRRVMRLESHGGIPNVIGGSSDNSVAEGVTGATIGGGLLNSNTSFFSTIGGGMNNLGSGFFATVGGGIRNTASGGSAVVGGGSYNTSSGEYAVVGGGGYNTSSGYCGTVGGGDYNLCSGVGATIGGGVLNNSSAEFAAVGGGRNNTSRGNYSSVVGGAGNTNSGWYAFVGGGYWNLIDPDADFATVGGGATNRIRSDADFATIGGGGDNVIQQDATFSTIGGGANNAIQVDADYATIGGGNNNSIGDNAGNSTISGGSWNGIGASASYATIGGGSDNNATWQKATVGGGFGNIAAADSATVAGGEGNYSLGGFSTVAGGQENRSVGAYSAIGGGLAHTADGAYSTIAGGIQNMILSNAHFAAIGGGQGNRIEKNSIEDGVPPAEHAVIGGGRENVVQGNGSVIGGGQYNFIEIGEDESAGDCVIGGGGGNRTKGDLLTIAGGAANRASSVGATIGGGGSHTASGFYSFIGGGYFNVASHDYAVVPGGLWNEASGGFSFAAGRRAKAKHLGAFVWSDASGHDPSQLFSFDSATTNEFAVRATGGVRFVTAIDATGSNIAGVTLAPGSGAWSSLSDRHAKENFTAANAREVLEKVSALPLATWNYKAQDKSIRHLGPMAQDFHAAFGLGESDCTITTVDADGVALAAIQGLHEVVKEKDAEIQSLKKSMTELQAAVARLAEQVRNNSQ